MPVDVFDFDAVPGHDNIVGVYGILNSTEASEIRAVAERKGGPLRDCVAFEDRNPDGSPHSATSVRAVCVFYLKRHAKRFRDWVRWSGQVEWWSSKRAPAWSGQGHLGALASSQRRVRSCSKAFAMAHLLTPCLPHPR